MEIDRDILHRLPWPLRVEVEENVTRKDFTQSELAGIQGKLIAELSKPELKRQGERSDLGAITSTENAVEVAKPKRVRNTTEKVARLFGESERTVRKRIDVATAAEAEPEKFGKLVADMDRTGRVDGPYKRLKVMRQAEAIKREPPALPNKGPYRVIIADPPWPYEKRKDDPSQRGTTPYPQMSIEQICDLGSGVKAIAHDDCILWLWTTNHHMREAFTVLDTWGFQQKTILTWGKDKMGMGDWLRGKTEHCLLAVRGRPTVTLTNQTTLYGASRDEHSKKPDGFYSFVEELCPASRYATLFHRGPTFPNWDGHGDEVGTDE